MLTPKWLWNNLSRRSISSYGSGGLLKYQTRTTDELRIRRCLVWKVECLVCNLMNVINSNDCKLTLKSQLTYCTGIFKLPTVVFFPSYCCICQLSGNVFVICNITQSIIITGIWYMDGIVTDVEFFHKRVCVKNVKICGLFIFLVETT